MVCLMYWYIFILGSAFTCYCIVIIIIAHASNVVFEKLLSMMNFKFFKLCIIECIVFYFIGMDLIVCTGGILFLCKSCLLKSLYDFFLFIKLLI